MRLIPARLISALATAAALHAAPAALAQDAADDAGAIVAVVNGAAVTFGDLEQAYIALTQGAAPPMDARTYDGVRDYLVGRRLIVDAAEADDLAADEEVAALLAQQREELLAQVYMARAIEARVTDDAVQAAYDAMVADMAPVEEVRASHILVETQEEAEALRAEIVGGAAFADVAREHGSDSTREQGGDLGWFTAERMVAPFAQAAFEAEEGAVTEPVETQFGWHLILVTGRRDQPIPTLDALRPQIEEGLTRDAAQSVVAELRGAAEIVLAQDRPGLPAPADADQ